MKDERWGSLIWLCLAILLIWVGTFAMGTRLTAARPSFGDLFTALAALFSGLAFAGVIYALRLQMRELALQREELQATRDELARSATAQEATQTGVENQVRVAALSALIEAAAKEGGQTGVYANEETLGTFQRAVAELKRLAQFDGLL